MKGNVEQVKEKYLGKKIRVRIDDPFHSILATGVVLEVDDIGQLHGTWGGLAAVPGADEITILD